MTEVVAPVLPYDETKFRNNATVVNVLVPLYDGLIMIRRAKEEGYGKLGIPGGFQEYGEKWRDTGAREFSEETGLKIDPKYIELFDIETDEWHHNVIIGLYTKLLPKKVKFNYDPKEVLEMVHLCEPAETAFPVHTAAVKKYFDLRKIHKGLL